MPSVNILKDWDYPNLLQQTPGSKGRWQNVDFFLNASHTTDYVVVLNYPMRDSTVTCPPQRIWAIMQEPPTEHKKIIHRGDPSYARVYTTDEHLTGKKYFHTQPALPWHINRTYDFLKTTGIPPKTNNISWVTSNQMVLKGHRERMAFLEQLSGNLKFDLFGHGFASIDDKWQAVAPYHYTIAIENFSNPFYWSEKIADCFLAWTMPIYYGCTQITEYFPAEAMILIDIHKPKEAIAQIQEAVQAQRWQKNLEAIRFARERVLEEYQLFPFIVEQIKREKKSFGGKKAYVVFIPAVPRTPRFFKENVQDLTGYFLKQLRKIYHKIKGVK